MPKDLGRVDYMGRLGCWRVVVYKGRRDETLGHYSTQKDAADALRNYVTETRRARRNRLHVQGFVNH